MSTKNLEQFFAGKRFQVPPYQRDYAWKKSNIDDLFDDISEALDLAGTHYLGTFILSQSKEDGVYLVVDGQQRLTTLTMLLDALVDALDDGKAKIIYESKYLEDFSKGKKFSVLGQNQTFFTSLLSKENVIPESEGQKRLKEAHQVMRERVRELKEQKGKQEIERWLEAVGKLDVLEFLTSDEGSAIRMFQSVNDRGVPLSKMDIAKSLLIYYSNRFLEGELDVFIAEKFGEAFRNYGIIRDLAKKEGYVVENISRASFSEDDILRYHYLAFDAGVSATFDWAATADTVLNDFLKKTLKSLRPNNENLKQFIGDYVSDLSEFFQTLKDILQALRIQKSLYLLFTVNGLAATLYPLVIRLAQRQLLNTTPNNASKTLLEMIEIADIRVFKLRGTNPQADIYRLTHKAQSLSVDQISLELRQFSERFMPDGMMKNQLENVGIYRNPVLVRILTELEECQSTLELSDLVELVNKEQTIEHILPQDPTVDVKDYGFESGEDYNLHIHRLGNLTLLEKSINSRCKNKPPEIKFSSDNLYRDSAYHITRVIANEYLTSNNRFTLDKINERSEKMAEHCIKLWALW